jgi:hypothetical protein
MSDLQLPFDDKPIFDKDYCDENDIRAEWSKYDKSMATIIEVLGREAVNDKGEWCIKNASAIGYAEVAISQYFLHGNISEELEKILNRRDMQLANYYFQLGKQNIEDGRKRIAENRYNGKKGGHSRNKNQT